MPEAVISRLFPLLLLACNVGAACVAFSRKDIALSVYWLASAVCIGMVTLQAK